MVLICGVVGRGGVWGLGGVGDCGDLDGGIGGSEPETIINKNNNNNE